MRNLNSNGILVASTSTPDLATSRRHFMSATTLPGGTVTKIARSAGSSRWITSSMPLSSVGHAAWNRTASSSV